MSSVIDPKTSPHAYEPADFHIGWREVPIRLADGSTEMVRIPLTLEIVRRSCHEFRIHSIPIIQTDDNAAYAIGWRDVPTTRPDGSQVILRKPLSLEDALHPELGDQMPETQIHEMIRTYLSEVFRSKLQEDPSALVLSDLIVYWDKAELKHNSPDICVIQGVRENKSFRTTFNVAKEGARPRLIIEIVSPSTRSNDIEKKFDIYHEAQVEYYVILDIMKHSDPWTLIGYHNTPAEYQVMETDDRGRLWLEPIGVWLGVEGQRVICYDGMTDAEIGDYVKLSQENLLLKTLAEAEKTRANHEKVKAAAEKLRADAEKQRADALEEELKRLRGEQR